MKRAKKAIIWLAVVLLIVLLLAGVLVYLFGEQAVAKGVERGASRSLGVEVTLGGVDLRPFGGQATLEELAVANPPDYQREQMLTMGSGEVSMEIRSLLGDTVNIRTINLDNMMVVLEQKGLTSNMQQVLENIRESQPQTQEPQRPGKQLHVDTLEITNATVVVRLMAAAGDQDTLTLKLAPIRLDNLGTDQPMNVADLAGRVLLAVAAGIAEQGGGVLPADLVGQLESQVAAYGQMGREMLEEADKNLRGVIEGQTEQVRERTEEMRRGVEENLRGLLPGRQQEDE